MSDYVTSGSYKASIFTARVCGKIMFSLRHSVNGDFCDHSSFFAFAPETDHNCSWTFAKSEFLGRGQILISIIQFNLNFKANPSTKIQANPSTELRPIPLPFRKIHVKPSAEF